MANLGGRKYGLRGAGAVLGGGSGMSISSGGASYLLDTYGGASAAYSVRKLKADATNALRVRRSSDNAEQDIGFVGEDLDTASMLTFVGAGNGFVVTWYDQSGNGNNATNALAASQPLIVSSGSLVTENGKVAADLDTGDFLAFTDITPLTTFTVAKLDAISTVNYILYNPTTVRGMFYGGGVGGVDGLGVFDGVLKTITGEDLNQHLGYFNYASTLYQIAKDGAAATNLAAGSNFTLKQIGRSTTSLSLNGKVQEVIIYATDNSANKAAIEANINTYFSIY